MSNFIAFLLYTCAVLLVLGALINHRRLRERMRQNVQDRVDAVFAEGLKEAERITERGGDVFRRTRGMGFVPSQPPLPEQGDAAECKVLLDQLRKTLNERARIEQVLFNVANGKRGPLSKEECRDMAARLGIPYEYRPTANCLVASLDIEAGDVIVIGKNAEYER